MAKTATARKTKTKSTTKKAASSAKTKAASAKKRTAKKAPAKKSTKARTAKSAGDEEVTIDRRRDQRREETEAKPDAPKQERRQKVQRRRQIDPTTCERDYSEAEVEFMNAMDEYKRTSGRMFPTCSEVLEVITSIGYAKVTPAELAILGRAPVEEVADELENEEADEFAQEAVLVG